MHQRICNAIANITSYAGSGLSRDLASGGCRSVSHPHSQFIQLLKFKMDVIHLTALALLCAYQYYDVPRLYHINKTRSQNGEGGGGAPEKLTQIGATARRGEERREDTSAPSSLSHSRSLV